MWREDGRGGAGRPDQLHLGQRQGAFTRDKDVGEVFSILQNTVVIATKDSLTLVSHLE